MDELQFTWDPAKAAANLSKHSVSFEDASSVFRNPLAKVLPDPAHGEHERRMIIIGHSVAGRLLLVIFTESDDRIRIISARDTSARERREYEEHS